MSPQVPKNPGITVGSVAICCISIRLLVILIRFLEIIEGSFHTGEGPFAGNILAVSAI